MVTQMWVNQSTQIRGIRFSSVEGWRKTLALGRALLLLIPSNPASAKGPISRGEEMFAFTESGFRLPASARIADANPAPSVVAQQKGSRPVGIEDDRFGYQLA